MKEYKFLVHFLNAKTHMFKILYSLLVYYELFFYEKHFQLLHQGMARACWKYNLTDL